MAAGCCGSRRRADTLAWRGASTGGRGRRRPGRALAPVAAAAIIWGAAAQVNAHEVRPAYLELRAAGAERLDVLWKTPARGDLRLALDPRLPATCEDDGERIAISADGAVIERWRARCPGGLSGREIRIDGLAATLTDVLVRIERSGVATQTVRLTPDAPSFTVAETPGRVDVARTYAKLGVEHILLGVDHLLFVLALLLLVRGWRSLIGTVTAFTVAHSATLAAATLGWVHLPVQPVEAVIALSVMFVAGEIVHARDGRAGIASRAPWVAAFAFGLLHGFGFAGALSEIGLPAQALPWALLFFNLGVEAGQLVFVASAIAVTALWRRVGAPVPPRSAQTAAYLIGSLSAFWLIERVVSF